MLRYFFVLFKSKGRGELKSYPDLRRGIYIIA